MGHLQRLKSVLFLGVADKMLSLIGASGAEFDDGETKSGRK